MVTITEVHYPNETLFEIAYNGEAIFTASTRARAEEIASELFGVLE